MGQCYNVASDIALIELLKCLHKPSESLQKMSRNPNWSEKWQGLILTLQINHWGLVQIGFKGMSNNVHNRTWKQKVYGLTGAMFDAAKWEYKQKKSPHLRLLSLHIRVNGP